MRMRFWDRKMGRTPFLIQTPTARLVTLLSMFATALFIPLGFLANHVYHQFAEKVYYDYKWNAEQVVKHTNKQIYEMLVEESKRPFADYQFYKWVTDPLTNKKEKIQSPLAHYEEIKHIPGYIGHFQIDSNERLCSPILPYIERKHLNRKAGMEWDEISKRLEKQSYIKELLVSNGLLKLPEIKGSANPWHNDQNNGSVKETKKEARNSNETELKARKEQSYSSKGVERESWQPGQANLHNDYTTFQVEIDPFQWKRGNSGHYFFYRKVWRKNRHYIQGFIADENEFLTRVIPLC